MADEVIVKFQADISDIQKDLNTLKGQMAGIHTQAEQSAKKTESAIGGAMKSIGPQILAAFSVGALVGFAKKAVEVTIQFEKLGAVLANTLGSKSLAQKAFNDIKDFAAKTNFSVIELTESFVKLSNAGFTPTTKELQKLGDLANSSGKSFDQLTEAIIDAQTGEFERLKEVGVRAQKEGDKVAFTFKGVKTQTDFTNESIRSYILSLGDLNGVSGSTAAISETLGGKLSNVGDAMDSFADAIGQLASPIIAQILNDLTYGLNALKGALGNAQKSFKDSIDIEDRYAKSINEVGNALRIRFRDLRANFSDEQKRSEIIKDINKNYGEYLPALLTEKTTFQQLNTILGETEKKLTNKISLAKSEEEINKLYKEQAEQLKAISDLEKARDITARQQPDRAVEVRTSFNELISVQKRELQQTTDLIALIEKESAAYSNLNVKKTSTAPLDTSKKEKKELNEYELAVKKVADALEKLKINTAKGISSNEDIDNLAKAKNELERINKEIALNISLGEKIENRGADTNFAERTIPVEITNTDPSKVKKANTPETDEEKQARQDRNNADIDAAQNLANSLNEISQQITDQRINDLQEAANKEQALLEEQLKNKGLTEKQYQEKVLALNKRTAEEIRKERIKQFNIDKALAIANITIDTAQGIAKAVALGPASAFVIPLLAGIGAAQLALVASQQPPKYEKGGKIKGSRHRDGGVLIEAEGGEYIAPIHAANKYFPELEAMKNNTFDKLMERKYLAPALKKQKEQYEQSLASNIWKSMQVNASLNDDNLLGSDRQTRKVLYQILEATKSNKNSNNIRFRNV